MSERWEPETIPMRENIVEIRDESGRRVCAVPADYPLSGHSWNRRIAIIAAAPEMLELLRKLAVGYDEDDGQGIYQRIDDFIDFTHEAQALIAKVEGGTK